MSIMKKTLIVLLIFAVAAAIITPADPLSHLVVTIEMLIIYCILMFIVSRFKSYAQTPQDIKKLIMVMICLLSMTIAYSVTSFSYRRNYHHLRVEHFKCPASQEQTQMESQ